MEAVTSSVTPFVYSSSPSTSSDEVKNFINVAFCLKLSASEINDTLRTFPVWKIDKMSSICTTIDIMKSVPLFTALATGLTGNILALLTMLQFPRTPATFYMALLAVSDWMALLTKAMNVSLNSFLLHTNWSCKLVNTLTNFTAIYANWVLVLICFERLVTVLLPLKKAYYYTIKRAYLSAAVLAVVIFLICSTTLWSFEFAGDGCYYIDHNFGNKWNQVETTLYCYIPSVLMIVMVSIIWRAFSRVQENRRLVFCGDDGAGANTLTEQRLRDQAKTERSITLMLLFSSLVFIVLTVPYCVMIVVHANVDWNYLSIIYLRFILGYYFTVGLVQLSHAVNFLVYFVSTKRFRIHLWKFLRCPRFVRHKSQLDRTEQTMVDLL